jgi:hypothetical protein
MSRPVGTTCTIISTGMGTLYCREQDTRYGTLLLGWLQNVSAAEGLSLHHVHNMEASDIGSDGRCLQRCTFFLALNQGISFNEILMKCQINWSHNIEY